MYWIYGVIHMYGYPITSQLVQNTDSHWKYYDSIKYTGLVSKW